MSNQPNSALPLLRDEYTAKWYHQLGFNILPLRPQSKSPQEGWKKWQTALQQWESDLTSCDWSHGLAAVNGINGWHSIDIDHGPSRRILEQALDCLGLQKDYPWVVQSGSKEGWHIWFRCTEAIPQDFPLTSKGVVVGTPRQEQEAFFTQMEVRWERNYTVLPPTIHPSGDTYTWANCIPERAPEPVSIELVQNLFFTLCADPQEDSLDTWSHTARIQEFQTQIAGPADLLLPQRKWLKKKLESGLKEIATAHEGERNSTLNAVAFSLGRYLAAHCYEEELLVGRLYEAAVVVGLAEGEIERTMKSALKASEAQPRIPPLPALLQSLQKTVEDTRVQEESASYTSSSFIGPDLTDQQIADFTPDDAGNAEAMNALYSWKYRYCAAYGWMVWNGTYWQANKGELDYDVITLLRRRQLIGVIHRREELASCAKGNSSRIRACCETFKHHVFIDVNEFDACKDEVNCVNGILHLSSGTITPHDPYRYFTYCIPIPYEKRDYDEWMNFLMSIVGGGKEVIEYLQTCVGYSLTGYTNEECLFYIYGPSRSGKGTFSEALQRLMPEPLSASVDFETFTAKRDGDTNNFDLAPLKAARIIFASESRKYQQLNPAKTKQMTGGDKIYCAYKHKDMFTYYPQYKIWMMSNHPVNADVDDTALWGRIRVVEFPNSYLGKEDQSLKMGMSSPQMLSQVFAWAVEGAIAWYALKHKGLRVPEYVKKSGLSQRAELDHVGQWLEECTAIVSDGWTENEQIMSSYVNWCKANNLEPKKGKSLTEALNNKGYTSARKWSPLAKRIVRGIKGIKIQNHDEHDEP